MKIGFIGAGNMGGALIGGMISARAVKPKDVWVCDQDAQKISRLCRARGVRPARSNEEAARHSHIVFLCVKPAQIREVLLDVSWVVKASSQRKIVVSIAAGVPLSLLESGLPAKTPVIRVMPNTPALLSAGMSVLSGGRWASSRDVEAARRLFATVGETVVLNEKHMNAVTAVSGSGPAYVFYLCEAMMEACRSLGLPTEASRLLCRQTIFGAGLMLKKLPVEARDLRIQVTSPGGTTEAAIRSLEKVSARRRIREAIRAASRRARELARSAKRG